MHKFAKLTTATMLGALIMGAASGCDESADLLLWTGFGSSYSTAVQSLIDRYTEASKVTIEHQSQGSYDKLQTNISNSISTAAYPNVANGYPDHFAGYIKSSIQLPLDSYIAAYNQEHGGSLIDDYYPEYMVENETLRYHTDGTPYIMGLPFNKSTELMGYNHYFMEYAKSTDATLKVPETWAEWEVLGPKFLDVMDNLYEKYLFAVVDSADPDKLSDFKVQSSSDAPDADHELLLDCSKVTKAKFRLLCWDATDNMFITIVRQWGGIYTSFTSEDASKYQHGWAEFNTTENAPKTKAAMQYFKNLYDAGVFGLSSDISDDSYSSTGFKNNQCMFTICSSGGLSYNIGTSRLKLTAIPYYDDGTTQRKYVISQGTNLALFDQGDDATKQKAFDMIVAFSKGEIQARWASETGYYPASKSATANEVYQSLLKTKQENPTKRAYQESAVLNENTYMNSDEKWIKFVDPGFVGSSSIRAEVKTIMGIAFAGDKDFDTILNESCNRLKDYVRK